MNAQSMMRAMSNRRGVFAQLIARVLILAGPGAALVAATNVDQAPIPSLLVFGVMGLAFLTAVFPDSHTGTVLIVWFGWYWLARIDDRENAWVLVAALGLAQFHVAVALAALGPPTTPIDGVVATRWLLRLVPVAAATAVVWALSVAMVESESGSSSLLLGVALVLLTAAALLASRHSRPDRRSL